MYRFDVDRSMAAYGGIIFVRVCGIKGFNAPLVMHVGVE